MKIISAAILGAIIFGIIMLLAGTARAAPPITEGQTVRGNLICKSEEDLELVIQIYGKMNRKQIAVYLNQGFKKTGCVANQNGFPMVVTDIVTAARWVWSLNQKSHVQLQILKGFNPYAPEQVGFMWHVLKVGKGA